MTIKSNAGIPIAVAARMIPDKDRDEVLDPTVLRRRAKELGLIVTCADGRHGLAPATVEYFTRCFRKFGRLTPRGGGQFGPKEKAHAVA